MYLVPTAVATAYHHAVLLLVNNCLETLLVLRAAMADAQERIAEIKRKTEEKRAKLVRFGPCLLPRKGSDI